MIHMKRALSPPAAGTVIPQANMMLRNRLQSTALPPSSVGPYAQPINTTEPTLQWVVETGTPTLLASSTQPADAISMVKPLKRTESETVKKLCDRKCLFSRFNSRCWNDFC
jgi:hypothetical protein